MSLRSKIFLILVTVVVFYAAIDNGVNRLTASRLFGDWERGDADEELARVRGRIEEELSELTGKARMLAGLQALSAFVAAPSPEFVAGNLGIEALQDAGVDLLYVCDASGTVLWGSILDPGTREPMSLPSFPRGALSPNHPAIAFRAGEQHVSGVLMTRFHPLLFSTLPIPGPDGAAFAPVAATAEDQPSFRGPAHGAVVLGRFLGPELREELLGSERVLATRDRVGGAQRIELLETGAPGLPAAALDPTRPRHFEPADDGLLHAYERIDMLRTGEPLVLHVALDRVMTARKRLLVNYASLSALAGGLLVLFVLLRLLQSVVLVPLSTLTQKAVEIGKRDDTSIRVNLARPDEIGQLAGEFDRMLEKLARSREQVIETARLAGMSEIATGVLHNVGNVLNSVNVAANLATRKTDDLSVKDLELLVGVLQKHEQDLAGFVVKDPRGKHLVPFLNELVRALGTQKCAIQEELRALAQGIEHMAELVRAQQSFAGTKGVFERAVLAEQVESAVSICRQKLGSKIEIVREFEELPAVRVDKHKLMEILVNVIQNAGQAMAETGRDDARLVLRILRAGEGKARIEVSDNGVGIPAANLTKVFRHGFTTKKDGHGFGLHVSANAATEMGAKLHARSDGPGKGATFALDLVMEEEPALAAA